MTTFFVGDQRAIVITIADGKVEITSRPLAWASEAPKGGWEAPPSEEVRAWAALAGAGGQGQPWAGEENCDCGHIYTGGWGNGELESGNSVSQGWKGAPAVGLWAGETDGGWGNGHGTFTGGWAQARTGKDPWGMDNAWATGADGAWGQAKIEHAHLGWGSEEQTGKEWKGAAENGWNADEEDQQDSGWGRADSGWGGSSAGAANEAAWGI